MTASLVTFGKKGVRKDFAIPERTIVIGRKSTADLRIPMAEVSRSHCEIFLSNGQLMLRDLNSSNGTFVNGQRVTKAALKAGDRVTIGPVVFTVQIDGKPANITAAPLPGAAQARPTAPTRLQPPASPAAPPAESPAKKPAADDDDLDLDDLGDLAIETLDDLDLDDLDDSGETLSEEDLEEIDEADLIPDDEPESKRK